MALASIFSLIRVICCAKDDEMTAMSDAFAGAWLYRVGDLDILETWDDP